MTGLALRTTIALTILLPLPAFPQAPGAAAPKAEAPPRPQDPAEEKAKKDFAAPETVPVVDLTHRYRFVELYTKTEEKAGPNLIGQYQVGAVEILKDSIDQPDGTKKETEIVRQTIYTERPAEVTGLGTVAATVRNYTRHVVRPEPPARIPGPRHLDGLTIFYRHRVGEPPVIMSLSEDRRLREREYEVATRQLFMPALPLMFPTYPTRVGDTWRLSKRAAAALLGDGGAGLKGENLTARFEELRRETKSKRMFAVFSVSGRVANALAETAINARVEFAFEPPPPSGAAPGTIPIVPIPKTRSSDESVVEARGGIVELRMGRVATGVLPDAAKRLNYVASQELILRRKIGTEPGAAPLKLFDAPPATDVNTWITHVDPAGRFFYNHPQDLLPPERFQLSASASDDSMVYVKVRNDGREMVRVDMFDKPMEPDALQDVLNAEWKRLKGEVIPGPSEWMPADAFLAPTKVYRIEAAIKIGTRGARMHYDAYLVRVSPTMSFMFIATTTREGVESFRRDVERMIGSLRTGQVRTP